MDDLPDGAADLRWQGRVSSLAMLGAMPSTGDTHGSQGLGRSFVCERLSQHHIIIRVYVITSSPVRAAGVVQVEVGSCREVPRPHSTFPGPPVLVTQEHVVVGQHGQLALHAPVERNDARAACPEAHCHCMKGHGLGIMKSRCAATVHVTAQSENPLLYGFVRIAMCYIQCWM